MTSIFWAVRWNRSQQDRRGSGARSLRSAHLANLAKSAWLQMPTPSRLRIDRLAVKLVRLALLGEENRLIGLKMPSRSFDAGQKTAGCSGAIRRKRR